MNPTTRSTTPSSRRRLFLTAGVVAAGLSLAGAGAAMAEDEAPGSAEVSEEAPAPAPAPDPTVTDGYTQERADAFWGAGYAWADVEALTALWQVDYAEAKARAGQLLLDGLPVPVAPTGPDEVYVELDPTSPEAILLAAQHAAFWDAGYTGEDVDALSVLWNSEFMETKARAGQMILDGEALPIAPASTPATS